jgi:type II secretory pathway component PulF
MNHGENVDLLGFGLVGVPGLIRYAIFLTFVAACGYGVYLLFTRGPLGGLLSRGLMHVPGLGASLRVMSLARIAWTLGLAMDAGADVRRSMQLALKSTANSYYTQHGAAIDRAIRSGQELHTTLRNTQAFPEEFLDAVQVGEESGRVSESLSKLAEQYQDQARALGTGLTVAASVGVWIFVAMILIFLIFRLFGAYMGIVNGALEGI